MTTVNLAKKIIELEMNPIENKDEIRRLTAILVSGVSTGRISVDLIDEDNSEITHSVLVITGHDIYLGVDGYSDFFTTNDGEIAKIEIYKQDLRILTWSDINQEDVTNIVSFKDALISNRLESLEG